MSTTLTAKLDEMTSRFKKATPGPWLVTGTDPHTDTNMRYVKVRGSIPGFKWHIADVRYAHGPGYSGEREAVSLAEFIANSITDIAILVAALSKALEQREEYVNRGWIREIQATQDNAEISAILEGSQSELKGVE